MKKTIVRILALFLVIVTFGGCSGNKPLSGKVTFDDEQPVPCGSVVFVKTGEPFQAQGAIKPDGSYTVGTLKKDDGLPPGDYTVYVTGVMEESGNMAGGTPQYRSLVDKKYESAKTSELKVSIPAQSHRFDIKLERSK